LNLSDKKRTKEKNRKEETAMFRFRTLLAAFFMPP